MLRAIATFATMLTLAVAPGCASLGLESPATFNQRIAYAYANATGARTAALNALNAGTITADDAEHVQTLADRAREGIDAARELVSIGKPDDAAARLRLAEGVIAQISAFLKQRGDP